MNRIETHRSEIRRSVTGPAWHGPALFEALDGVTAEAALEKNNGTHSIAELAFHAVAWIEEVHRRLKGAEPAYPERGDWPSSDAQAATLWPEITTLLQSAIDALDSDLAQFPEKRLEQIVGKPVFDPETASGTTNDAMLLGLVQHNAYHGGQISQLKAAISNRKGHK